MRFSSLRTTFDRRKRCISPRLVKCSDASRRVTENPQGSSSALAHTPSIVKVTRPSPAHRRASPSFFAQTPRARNAGPSFAERTPAGTSVVEAPKRKPKRRRASPEFPHADSSAQDAGPSFTERARAATRAAKRHRACRRFSTQTQVSGLQVSGVVFKAWQAVGRYLIGTTYPLIRAPRSTALIRASRSTDERR